MEYYTIDYFSEEVRKLSNSIKRKEVSMKYFKAELWRGYNSDIKDEVEEARVQWEKNNKEYASLFEKVKQRLPKSFLKIYMREHGFYDFHLKNLKVIHGSEGFKNLISVSIEIGDEEKTWNIMYKGVTKVQINYEDENAQENNKRRFQYGFDDYGYDEFLEVDDNILSHEILFASDATILIHFKHISINKVTNLDA
jgi:hypothetical protein